MDAKAIVKQVFLREFPRLVDRESLLEILQYDRGETIHVVEVIIKNLRATVAYDDREVGLNEEEIEGRAIICALDFRCFILDELESGRLGQEVKDLVL